MLILHANPLLAGSANNCGFSELRDCKGAVTQVPADGKVVIFFVLAAFADFASPRIQVVTFGIQYDNPDLEPIARGFCQASLELSTTDWPLSRAGTALSFDPPLTDTLNEIYWFAVEANSPGTFKMIAHPTQGGNFTDDSIPAIDDRIDGYGMLGFGRRGANPCAPEDLVGGCCDPDGRCILQTRAACEFLGVGHTYLGDNTSCYPNPCTPGMGACCVREECHLLSYTDCLDAGGTYVGSGISCSPFPCTPTYETSWGVIKQKYRGF